MAYEQATIFSSYPKLSFGVLMVFYGYLGYLIVTQYLMDKQIRSFLSKSIFTITFMCSLTLFTMYLYQVSSIDLSDELWDCILIVLVLMCTIIIPLCLLFKIPFISLRFSCKGSKLIILLSIIGLIYFRILTYLTLEMKDKKQIYYDYQIDIFSKKHINILVEIVVNYGVYISAIMTAYGSVWSPYVYYNYINTSQTKLKEAKQKSIKNVQQIIGLIKNIKYNSLLLQEDQRQLQFKLNESLKQKQQKNFNSYSRFFQYLPIFSKDPIKEQLKQIKKKIQGYKNQLETLQNYHYSQLQQNRKIVGQEIKHQIQQTFMGKLFSKLSWILVVNSIFKIILTVWNMIRGTKLSTDLITRLLNFFWGRGQDANGSFKILSQYISFVFIGYIMITNVRSFSMNIKKFFDFVLRRKRLEILQTDTIVLILSEIYGVYFLSTVVLLQSSLPRTYATNFEYITGQVRLVEHFKLFDKLFFWSCITVFIFVLISLCKIKNQTKLLKKHSKQQLQNKYFIK